jgi:hypothetical protein
VSSCFFPPDPAPGRALAKVELKVPIDPVSSPLAEKPVLWTSLSVEEDTERQWMAGWFPTTPASRVARRAAVQHLDTATTEDLEKSGAAALNAAMDRPVRENGGGREDEGLEGGDCCAPLKAARTETPHSARAGGQLGRGPGTIFFLFC